MPDTDALALLPEDERYVSELSAKQVFDRLAGCWTYWGWKGGYFTSEEDAFAFCDELGYMLAKQMVALKLRWNRLQQRHLHWPMASTAPARATTTSTSRPAS